MRKKVALLAFVSVLLFSAMFEGQFVEAKSSTTTEVVSTESTAASRCPSLAVDSFGNVHVAWMDDTKGYMGCGSNSHIFYKMKAGGNWTPTEIVSTESISNSYYASLAVDSNGNVHIAWEDWNPIYYRHEILYKMKAGGNWTSTEVVSTESNASSWYPSLAVDSNGNVHIAWQDETNYMGCGGNPDIFYKRFEVLPPPPVGGIWITPNKLELLAPWVALASTIISVLAATAIFLKRKRKKQ